MIARPIDEIAEADLQALIDNAVSERKTLEYKRQLPGTSDAARKEFLADVSSFANASGGDIVYGIAERSGVPVPPLEGMAITNADQEILRLESMVRDCIRPRIPGVRTKPVHLPNSNAAIVLRVPKSWASPHRIEASRKFYARSSNGKYELDVDELRAAFIASESLAERIRDFRADRIAKIVAGDTPMLLDEGAKTVLHLVPLSSFGARRIYDLSTIPSPTPDALIYSASSSWRHNFDGFLVYAREQNDRVTGYTQVYRHGMVEATDTGLLDNGSQIPSVVYERQLIRSTTHYLAMLRTMGVNPPVVLLLSLLGVKGYTMAYRPLRYTANKHSSIDRDHLALPDTLIDAYEVEAHTVLRPSFDAIWNACGFPRAMYYDDDGNWVPKR